MGKALNTSGRHIHFNMCEWGNENPVRRPHATMPLPRSGPFVITSPCHCRALVPLLLPHHAIAALWSLACYLTMPLPRSGPFVITSRSTPADIARRPPLLFTCTLRPQWEWGFDCAQSWRMSGDHTGTWSSTKSQIQKSAAIPAECVPRPPSPYPACPADWSLNGASFA